MSNGGSDNSDSVGDSGGDSSGGDSDSGSGGGGGGGGNFFPHHNKIWKNKLSSCESFLCWFSPKYVQ